MGSSAKDAAAAWPGSESAGSLEASGGDGGDVNTPRASEFKSMLANYVTVELSVG